MRALLIGGAPPCDLGCTYSREPPYEGVVIGSLTLSQALYFRDERVLTALAEGKPVLMYGPGFPEAPGNRALGAELAAGRRKMKNWGIRFAEGARRQLITGEEARALRRSGQMPGPGAVLTPLAKEILEGK